jgi:hypothetical protein
MAQELKVIEDFYELTSYLVGRIARFPRQHRYSLGTDMERRLQAVLALLIQAKYAAGGEDKSALLRTANVELEVLRFQLRLARDLAALAQSSHGHAIKLAAQVGSQIGGWLKAVSQPARAKA